MAPPLVLLHPLGETRASWDDLLPALSQRREVHAIDLRGHGDAPWNPPYTFDRMRDDVVDLLEARRLDQVDLVGHSLGGAIAARSPRRTRAAYVVSSSKTSARCDRAPRARLSGPTHRCRSTGTWS